jgi:predicted nucleic acid-binding protein
MPSSFVLDASVAAKLHFLEEGSDQAGVAVRRADRLIAPDLLFLEMASIAAKNVRRGTASSEQAVRAVRSVSGLLDEVIGLIGLASGAFELAAMNGFSVYDGVYLALAEMRGIKVLTADYRLVKRAESSGLSHLVEALAL